MIKQLAEDAKKIENEDFRALVWIIWIKISAYEGLGRFEEVKNLLKELKEDYKEDRQFK